MTDMGPWTIIGIVMDELPSPLMWPFWLDEGDVLSKEAASCIRQAIGASVFEVVCEGDTLAWWEQDDTGSYTAWFRVPLFSPKISVKVEWLQIPSVQGDAAWSWEAPDPAPPYVQANPRCLRMLESVGIVRHRTTGSDSFIKPGDSLLIRFKEPVEGKFTHFNFLQMVLPKGLSKSVFRDPAHSRYSQQLGKVGSFLWHYEDEKSFPQRCVLAGIMPRPCGTELEYEVNVSALQPTPLTRDRMQMLYGTDLVMEKVRFLRMKCQVVSCSSACTALGSKEDIELLRTGVDPTDADAHGAPPQKIDHYLDLPGHDVVGVIHGNDPSCYNVPVFNVGHIFEMPRRFTVMDNSLILLPSFQKYKKTTPTSVKWDLKATDFPGYSLSLVNV